MSAHRAFRGGLALGLVVSLVAPAHLAWSGAGSLGTARGVRGIELSLDHGKSWLPLGARSLPVLDGTRVRSTSGGALIDFTDGSRLNVLPFTDLRFRDTGTATEVSLTHGRLAFHLSRATRVELRGALARLTPVGGGDMVGEVFAGADGTIGLQMRQGSLQVEELTGAKRTMTASLEPVFVPKRPAQPGPLFSSDPQPAAPAGARGVFNPQGESLGYLQAAGQLVVHPGYTADLTRPFPPKLVQVAMARVPERDRSDAVPVFDVNGGYVGYLAGPAFYAQAGGQTQTQVAQAPFGGGGGAGGGGGGGGAALWVAGGLFLITGGVIGYGASQHSNGCGSVSGQVPPGPPATPVGPCR
jgi:hypothetical protein